MKKMIYPVILLMSFPWLAGAGTFFAVNSATHNLWLTLFVAGTVAGDLGFFIATIYVKQYLKNKGGKE